MSEPVRGEALEVRFLARTPDYEIALLVPPPACRLRPPAKPLVRLRFRGGQGEVVLTLAEVGAFTTDLQQLQAYLQHERTTALTKNDDDPGGRGHMCAPSAVPPSL
jgi:hypothetical protein